MKQQAVVNLDDLLAERKVILNGKEVKVRPIDGVGYEMMQQIQQAETEEEKQSNVSRMYQIAKRCVESDSSRAEYVDVMALTPAQVGALVGVAGSAVKSVEETAPKTKTARRKGAGTPSS
jgi:hypothetical protein